MPTLGALITSIHLPHHQPRQTLEFEPDASNLTAVASEFVSRSGLAGPEPPDAMVDRILVSFSQRIDNFVATQFGT